MNDFVSLLVSAAAFCASYIALGLLARVAIVLGWAPDGLAEGSFLQLALAVVVGMAAWRRMVRPPAPETPARA